MGGWRNQFSKIFPVKRTLRDIFIILPPKGKFHRLKKEEMEGIWLVSRWSP
jgi:hypothetical protein